MAMETLKWGQILFGAICVMGGRETAVGGIQFVDVTRESGITFRHTDGSSGRRYIVEIEMAGLLGHARVKHHLKKQVPEFITQVCHVIALDRIGNFVSLFNRIRRDTGKILLDIPWTAVVRVAELVHYFK